MRLAPAFPLQSSLLPLRWRTLCRAAANDDPCPLLSRSGDRRLVFTLDRRVRDLKDVEHTHRNVLRQMWQCAGHADKPHLAGIPEFQEGFEGAVFFEGPLGRRRVKLDDIEVVGLHSREALLDPGDDVVAGEDMLPALTARRSGCTD